MQQRPMPGHRPSGRGASGAIKRSEHAAARRRRARALRLARKHKPWKTEEQ